MSQTAAPYLFSFPSSTKATDTTYSAFSSSPDSTTGVDGFDFESPLSIDFDFDGTFGLSPSSSSAPSSVHVVSPKSSSINVDDFNLVADSELDKDSPTNLNTAEALSNHHLQRYLHYKALAEQAEAQHKKFTEQLESLFPFGMPVDPATNVNITFGSGDAVKDASVANGNMLAFHPQAPASVTVPPPQQPIYGAYQPTWQHAPAPIVPNQSSDMFHAQAQAHMQAHQAAQAAQVSMSAIPAMSSVPVPAQAYYMPTSQTDSTAWSRQSTSSIASASAPTTPAAPLAVPMTTSVTAPTIAMSTIASSEGESELDRHSVVSDDDIKPQLPMDIPLTNLNGGGRGYVPGQTPDDPKKRHKCNVCGRGFARAFNLKSHVQTHNPLRQKPHVCPHRNCNRGFSRLHDLERHRQGIHSDGPLVEAKYQGVTPSVARAKDRIQKRAESGSLI